MLLAAIVSSTTACRPAAGTASLTQIQSVKTATLEIVLLSDHDGLHHGNDAFVIEFKSVSDGHLVDVGTVRANASMPMPGMPMFGSIDVQRTGVPGRYTAAGEFSMAGTWRMTMEWAGRDGTGSVSFSGAVQ